MKIFFDATAIQSYPNGIAVYVRQLLNEFVKYPDIEIYTGAKSLNFKSHKKLQQLLGELVDKKITYQAVYWPGRFSLCGIQQVLPHLKCDLVHYPGNIIPPYLPCLEAENSIITIHDMFMWHKDLGLYEKEITSFYHQYQPDQAKKCTAIVTDSEFSKKEIVKFFGVPAEKIHVIPLATQWNQPMPEKCDILSGYGLEEKRYFISVSSLNKHKNFPGLCHAFAKYHDSKEYGGEKLVIVGGRRYGDEDIYELMQRTPDVIHIPRVSEGELRYLYAKAKGFFLVSKLEGFGIPLLEAMSSHIPACYGKGNSMDEIGRDAAVGVDPDDIDGIADVFRYFSEAPAELQTRVERAYQISQEYTWCSTAEKHYDLYQKVCEK